MLVCSPTTITLVAVDLTSVPARFMFWS